MLATAIGSGRQMEVLLANQSVEVVGGLKRGARVKAVREMPRPCVEDIEQAQGNLKYTKSSLTSDVQCTSNSC